MLRAAIIIFTLIMLLFGPPAMHDFYSGKLAFAQTASPPVTPTQSEKLRNMDILMGEHTVLLTHILTARYARAPHYQPGREALDRNTRELGIVIGDFYGQNAGSQFATIWNRHIDSFIRYTDAKRNNDQSVQAQSIRELQSFTESAARLLSRGNEEMYAIAQNYFSQHVLGQKRIIDAYQERNYDVMYDEMAKEYRHASLMTIKLQ